MPTRSRTQRVTMVATIDEESSLEVSHRNDTKAVVKNSASSTLPPKPNNKKRIHWNYKVVKRRHHRLCDLSDEEKEAVWKRLEKLKSLIMQSKVEIFDEDLMEYKIDELQLKINKDLNSLSKAFEIVKLTSQSFENLKEFGINLNEEGKLVELKEVIETELYELSTAHFKRYFVEPIEKLNKN